MARSFTMPSFTPSSASSHRGLALASRPFALLVFSAVYRLAQWYAFIILSPIFLWDFPDQFLRVRTSPVGARSLTSATECDWAAVRGPRFVCSFVYLGDLWA